MNELAIEMAAIEEEISDSMALSAYVALAYRTLAKEWRPKKAPRRGQLRDFVVLCQHVFESNSGQEKRGYRCEIFVDYADQREPFFAMIVSEFGVSWKEAIELALFRSLNL